MSDLRTLLAICPGITDVVVDHDAATGWNTVTGKFSDWAFTVRSHSDNPQEAAEHAYRMIQYDYAHRAVTSG